MKIKSLLWLAALGLLIANNPNSAQAQSTLGIQLYAGVSITGAVGTVYAIQANTNLTNTNSWITVNFIQLPTTNYLWTDTSTAAMGQMFYRAVATAPTNLVFIPPGTFRMGSPTNELNRNSNEGPQTAVTISKGFFMGKYQVTQTNYVLVVGSLPSVIDFTDPNYPIWNGNKTNYCALLTQQQLAAGLIPLGSHYRLPTEAEWEYACRAGTSDRAFYYGDDVGYTNLTNYAWFADNSADAPHPVGQKLPNQWGLYDMSGNIMEMCQDWYGDTLPGGSVIDPQGPPVSGAHNDSKVVRKSTFDDVAGNCRSARRQNLHSADSGVLRHVGFRVVLVSGQ